MIKNPKIESLLLSGNETNIALGLALGKSQNIDLHPLLKDMAQMANFLISACGYMIYYVELEDLPSILSEVKRLEVESFFKQEKILELPDKLQYLPNLEEIYLTGLGLRSLPKSIGSCQHLRQINVMDNELRELPKEFASCQQLEAINLSHNPLAEFPMVFCELPNLEKLYLYQSALIDLPMEIEQLSNLKRLFLSNNLIFELPQSFGNLGNLKELDLSRCQLESLPKCFSNLKSLLRLDLMGNPLKNWTREIGLNALEYMSVSNFPKGLKQPNLLELALVIDQELPRNWMDVFSAFTGLEKLQIFVKKELELAAIELPENLLSLESLKKIEINNLSLRSIPEAYKRAFHLEELFFFNTEMEHLDQVQTEFEMAYLESETRVIVT